MPKPVVQGVQTALEPEPAEQETPSPLARAVPPETPPARLIGEAMHTYILVEKGDTLILIDKHAAHERINFDRLRQNPADIPSQTLLEPLPFTPDESDADESFFTRLDEKSYLFDGKSHLGDFERVLGIDEETFADVKGDAETLAGLMLELKRDFPRKGDVFTSHDIRFTVQEMDGHRVDKIRVDLQ